MIRGVIFVSHNTGRHSSRGGEICTFDVIVLVFAGIGMRFSAAGETRRYDTGTTYFFVGPT